MLAERPLPEDLADRLDALGRAWSAWPSRKTSFDAIWTRRIFDVCSMQVPPTGSARSALPADPVVVRRRVRVIERSLRTLLVHGYLDIDHGRLFDELDWIERTETFAGAIERWLAQNVGV